MLTLAYCFTPAGRCEYQKRLREARITILDDNDLNSIEPINLEYRLYTQDYFGDEMVAQLNFKFSQINESFLNETETHQNYSDINTGNTVNPSFSENVTINNSDIWVFPDNMMNKSSSILFLDQPWLEPNANHSINGQKLTYNNRPMADIEFQYPPFHPNLIECTLQEILRRLQYNENDICCAQIAFKHWCTTVIGVNGLNILELYKASSERELWEKIRSNFINNERGNNDLCRGYPIISDLALTFISCSASEAQCERYISNQRLAIHRNTRNINDDYLDALWLLSSHRKHIMKYFNH